MSSTQAPKTDAEKKDAPKIFMLPPTMLVLHISAGIILDWIFPYNFGHAWGWLGLLLFGGALGLITWAKKCFEDAGTNLPPNQPALSIVTNGPFQYTRNPMYLGFLLGFTGLAFLADAPTMLLVLLPLFYLLDQKTIAPEEEYLTEKFGSEYTDYKEQVHRWITIPQTDKGL